MEPSIEELITTKYLKSLIKHIYRWSRISSYQQNSLSHSLKKINQIFEEINTDFKNGHYPAKDDKIFYKTYNHLMNKFVTKKRIQTSTKFVKKITENDEIYNKNSNQENQQIQPIQQNDRKRSQKVLIMLDYDDTLIPTTLIKQKDFRVTEMNLSEHEQSQLHEYVDSLNKFTKKLLTVFNNNHNDNIKIITNAASTWVSEGSFCRTGALFAQLMRPFNEVMAGAKIGIISAHDHHERNKAIFGDVKFRKYKRYLMKWLYAEYFGVQLTNCDEDIKIISIGDSLMEFRGCNIALQYYLHEQSKDVLDKINVCLHRVKFRTKPQSFATLSNELKWCYENIENIVCENHISTDYDLEFIE